MHSANAAYQQQRNHTVSDLQLMVSVTHKGMKLLNDARLAGPDSNQLLRKAITYNNDLWFHLEDLANSPASQLSEPARNWMLQAAAFSIAVGRQILERKIDLSHLENLININRRLVHSTQSAQQK